MHIFIAKSLKGVITPLGLTKQSLLQKLLKSYEEQNKAFKITIEELSKDISSEQIKLYRAFIFKASNHFGNTYAEMEELLLQFYPIDIDNKKLVLEKWSSKDLDEFINKSTSHLAEFGFHF